MLNKYKFVYTVLLVLLLSMGSMFSQEATPPPAPPAPSGRVALTLEPRVEGLELSVLQVGNTCVPPVFGRYTLNAKVPQAPWAAMLTYVPPNPADRLPLGDFKPKVWAFNSFSEKRGLKAGLSQEFEINKISDRITYIMVPDFWNWSQEPSATCGPALDFWEIPVLVMGEPEPGVLSGVGTALSKASVDLEKQTVFFEVVAHNPSDILVFQGTEFGGKPYTYQTVYTTETRGTHAFQLPLSRLMVNQKVQIHLRDRRTNVSWTTDLLGGRALQLPSGGAIYNPDIARYCAVFTGNTECKLPDETELRSRSAEEVPDLQWFWELTGQATRRR